MLNYTEFTSKHHESKKFGDHFSFSFFKNVFGATKVVGNKKNPHTTGEITKNRNTKFFGFMVF